MTKDGNFRKENLDFLLDEDQKLKNRLSGIVN
jgi:hypothetical protein